MPWTVLGKKWHLARKGFPPGKSVAWELETLEELLEMLQAAAPSTQFLWNNHLTVSAMIKGQRDPWVRVWTKKPGAIDLILSGPKGRFTLGQVAGFGVDPQFDSSRQDIDIIKLQFIAEQHLHQGDLAAFLRDHAAATQAVDDNRPLFRKKEQAAFANEPLAGNNVPDSSS